MADESVPETVAKELVKAIGGFTRATINKEDILRDIREAQTALRESAESLSQVAALRARWFAGSVDLEDLDGVKKSFDEIQDVFSEATSRAMKELSDLRL
jgi:hypothetical protein